MDYQLSGKLAFVAAGAHGIGEAVADLLTAEGAVVIVADQDQETLEQKASKGRRVVAADLARAAGVTDAVDHALHTFGRVPDILINNLGVGNANQFDLLTD